MVAVVAAPRVAVVVAPTAVAAPRVVVAVAPTAVAAPRGVVAVALTAEGTRTFRELWVAGEPIRAQMLGALRADEAETLVGLLARVAEALIVESDPVGGAPSSLSEG